MLFQNGLLISVSNEQHYQYCSRSSITVIKFFKLKQFAVLCFKYYKLMSRPYISNKIYYQIIIYIKIRSKYSLYLKYSYMATHVLVSTRVCKYRESLCVYINCVHDASSPFSFPPVGVEGATVIGRPEPGFIRHPHRVQAN